MNSISLGVVTVGSSLNLILKVINLFVYMHIYIIIFHKERFSIVLFLFHFFTKTNQTEILNVQKTLA
jgi:type IV secretory pathway VirB3-like protein